MTMHNITLSPERRAEILRSVKPRHRTLHWTAARVTLAAVPAALLTFSALAAAVPALREALKNALGSFSEQSQPITGVAVEDNGIEVRPVAALSSSNLVRVWVEVQDKTGDRLNEDMRVGAWLEYPQDKDATEVNGWSSGAHVVYYDEASRTALIEIDDIGRPIADGAEVSVSLSSFQPAERAEETVDFPREMLSVTGLKNLPKEDVPWTIYEILPLVPEQTPHELEGTNHARLSSVGFGEDGKLHIQSVFADNADHWSGFHSDVTDSRDPNAIPLLGGHSSRATIMSTPRSKVPGISRSRWKRQTKSSITRTCRLAARWWKKSASPKSASLHGLPARALFWGVAQPTPSPKTAKSCI